MDTTATKLIFNKQLNQQITDFAESLKKAGLKPQDRVIVRFWNTIDFTVAYFGVIEAGGVAVTISPLLTPAEISHIYKHSEARLIVSFEEINFSNYENADDTRQWILDGANTIEKKPSALPVKGVGGYTPKDLKSIIYTSGTTGNPKGVMLTEQNIKAQLSAANKALELTSNDSFLGILSFSHVFGQMDILWAAKELGCSVHLLAHFDAKKALETIKEKKVSVLIAVPTMYQLMVRYLEKNPMSFPNLRVCHSGAAPMSEDLFEKIEKHFNAPVQEGYGLTETCSMAFSNPLKGPRKKLSVGKPIDGVKFKLIDENGNQITKVKEIGEVCIKGDIITPGYFREKELTQKASDNDGYLLTGDLGYFDEDGYLFLVDRKKDLIIRSGYKVYPREVEEVIQKHPLVMQVAIIGIDNELQSQKVKAYVVPKNHNQSIDDNNQLISELRDLCSSKLAKYKQPNFYEVVSQIPQTPSGKLLKRKLEE